MLLFVRLFLLLLILLYQCCIPSETSSSSLLLLLVFLQLQFAVDVAVSVVAVDDSAAVVMV